MAMADASSSLSSSFTPRRWTYDVFISFRGEDTRKTFVDHLYAALDQAGIYTFKGDKKLQRGKSISTELLKAIEESMIAVVVFSKNYANSSWCLEELVKIIECRELMGQIVLPVFYDVMPSDDLRQKKSFHAALEQHKLKLRDNKEKVAKWKKAMATATSLSGWGEVPKTASGHEVQIINNIVRHVLSYTESSPTEDLIGMESRVQHVNSLLGKGSDSDVYIIGIWGMGGIGKTTIARAVYNQISYEFEGSCFLVDVRENGSDDRGLQSLQEKLLSDILMTKEFKVKDCDDGASQIQKRLGSKKVLVVLDDVDRIRQLEFLAGSRKWFGYGSRIIITTRDEHLLTNAQEKYAPALLEETDAMKLFNRYAFKAKDPPKEYEELSTVVVSHTGYLPLAVKVVGSYFCGRNLAFWGSVLSVSIKIQHKVINEIPKLYGFNVLQYTRYHPSENLIGMESRVQHVKSLLGKGSDSDVYIIGIWGMGGIGKTTIVRAVYNQISYEFEGSSFLEDVGKNACDKRGLQSLQENLLSEILMQEHFKVKSCDDGVCQIRRRLSRKKVLIVLDDVDDMNQLKFLVGASEWFGPGSRIMITTRDKHLLCYTQDQYVPELLNETEAIRLFSRYAFKANDPPKAYQNLSGHVVRYTGYLPLTLKVLGSHFCDKYLEFWQSTLNILLKIPNNEIKEILKLSFDGLNILEQKIFLYIACFYKGSKKHDVTKIFDSCGFEAISGITVLIEKSLLNILDGRLHMHDLIQEMGQFIIRKCYPNTMVWVHEEIKELMTTNDKLETVEAMVETEDFDHRYSPNVFKNMKKLILLQVYGAFTSSEPTFYTEELRWLSWSKYPFQSISITRGLTKLVSLQLTNTLINQLQIENKVILINLKFMNLSESWALTSSPNISGLPNLEELNLSYCESLVEVHESVLLHKKIRNLILSFCKSLRILPPSIHMESLQSLSLEGCESLETFPEVTIDMRRLLLLNMYGCKKIKALPSSIRFFTSIVIFSIGKDSFSRSDYIMSMPPNKQRMPGFAFFTSLKILDLANNDLVDNDFPSDVHNAWPSLEELDLSDNLFTRLPACISRLSLLKYLDLRNCFNLIELHELPSYIQVVKADNCISLEKIGDLSNKYKLLFQISLHSCPELLEDQESESHVANFLSKSLIQNCAAVYHRLSITVPGCEIPNWFSNQMFGNTIALNIPQKQIIDIIGLAVCCVFSRLLLTIPIRLTISFQRSGVKNLIDMPTTVAAVKTSECVWIGYMPMEFLLNLSHGFEAKNIRISFKPDFTDCDRYCAGGIVKCGVCVVYKDDIKPMAGIGSWIPDYDGLKSIKSDCDSIEKLQHGRWSSTSFSMDDDNSVRVLI